MLIFHWTWKTLLWNHFGPFWSKKPRTKFLSKNQALSLCSLDDTLILWKKPRKFFRAVPEKNSRQTDKWMEGISQDLCFVGQTRWVLGYISKFLVSVSSWSSSLSLLQNTFLHPRHQQYSSYSGITGFCWPFLRHLLSIF